MPKRIPPVPVQPGHHFCYVCETPLPAGDFYQRRGKPSSPCKACAKKGPERRAALLALIEEARAEVRSVLARRPLPEPIIPEYQPMDGFARWLERERKKQGRKRQPSTTPHEPLSGPERPEETL